MALYAETYATAYKTVIVHHDGLIGFEFEEPLLSPDEAEEVARALLLAVSRARKLGRP